MFGGGIVRLGAPLALDHTIVAGNGAIISQFLRFGQDLTGLTGTVFNARFSLIGDNSDSGLAEAPVGAPDANGNLIGGPVNGTIDPLFGPLIDNGGPTWTHAIGIGSPALDSGDPASVAGMNGVPEFDQRGNPFVRVVGAAIDIGTFELPPLPPALLGDYNHDAIVDAADFTVWRDTLNANVAPYSGADGSGNGVVDQADCSVWKAHFGQTLPPLDAGRGGTTAAAPAEPVTQFAIAASQHSALPGGGAAAASAVNLAPSNSWPEAGANKLTARSARAATPPPSDAVFATIGQQTSARPIATRTPLRIAATDVAVADSLLLVGFRRLGRTADDNTVRADGHPWQDTDTRPERTRNLYDKWRTVVRGSADLVPILV
jgi:hypothetical protein